VFWSLQDVFAVLLVLLCRGCVDMLDSSRRLVRGSYRSVPFKLSPKHAYGWMKWRGRRQSRLILLLGCAGVACDDSLLERLPVGDTGENVLGNSRGQVLELCPLQSYPPRSLSCLLLDARYFLDDDLHEDEFCSKCAFTHTMKQFRNLPFDSCRCCDAPLDVMRFHVCRAIGRWLLL
jgi:hypothetical protein